MIDLITATECLSKEQLKARAMSRLSESGLGLAERLANMERLAYYLLDPKAFPISDMAQCRAIGGILTQVEKEYTAECADNETLRVVIAYEQDPSLPITPEILSLYQQRNPI